jgi:transposase
MKGAEVYHQIKALRRQYSLRGCARLLGISVNTVIKYDQMSLEEASSYFSQNQRGSQFDEARTFIIEELIRFPRIKAPKLLRKIRARYPSITAKERALRAYIAPFRQAISEGQDKKIRYYEPVLDMEPGVQVQVDIGEEWVEREGAGSLSAPMKSGAGRFKVYFVSFVFSYSRKKYAIFQGRPFDTESFINAHISAFRYFDGIAREYVYDQTKLVVINERYREVWFNERFYQFALKCGFSVRVCEGYDPESKGKVENAIRYTKGDFLYGDYFENVEAVNKAVLVWLDEVANHRQHSVTGRSPQEMFEEERPLLRPLPEDLQERPCRRADKTGLISFEGNKYSVPFQYQRQQVWVEKNEKQLIIRDRLSGEELARHLLVNGRGQIVKNNNHYRDYRQSLEELSKEAEQLFERLDDSRILILRLKADNPAIARDQLRGLIRLGKKYLEEIWQESFPLILQLPQLRVSLIEAVLQNCQLRRRATVVEMGYSTSCGGASPLDRSLDVYMLTCKQAGR